MKRFVQFIAGAICPECKSQDTIALNPTDDEIYCVNCDFVEKRPKEKSKDNIKEITVVNVEDFKKNREENRYKLILPTYIIRSTKKCFFTWLYIYK